jgi:hypothetical protein
MTRSTKLHIFTRLMRENAELRAEIRELKALLHGLAQQQIMQERELAEQQMVGSAVGSTLYDEEDTERDRLEKW